MMEHEYLHGRAFVKKSKGKIQIFETPYGLGDFVPVVAEGTTKPRMLKDRFADVVNVKDFGAKGDGVHDDTKAIQAAYDAVVRKGRGTIFFPEGFYRVTRYFDIYRQSSAANPVTVLFKGEGEDVTRIVADFESVPHAVFESIPSAALVENLKYWPRSSPTSFEGMSFGIGKNVDPKKAPGFIWIYGHGNSYLSHVTGYSSENTHFRSLSAQNVRFYQAASWFGGHTFAYKDTSALTFTTSADGTVTASADVFDPKDAGKLLTLKPSSSGTHASVVTIASVVDARTAKVTGNVYTFETVKALFEPARISIQAGSKTAKANAQCFTPYDVGRVIFIRKGKKGENGLGLLRAVIVGVSASGDSVTLNEAADNTVNDEFFGQAAVEIFNPYNATDTTSSDVKLYQLHVEHYRGIGMVNGRCDSYMLIGGKIHGTTYETSAEASSSALWLDDADGSYQLTFDTGTSTTDSIAYACNLNSSVIFSDLFYRGLRGQKLVKTEAMTSASGCVVLQGYKSYNIFASPDDIIQDENATPRTKVFGVCQGAFGSQIYPYIGNSTHVDNGNVLIHEGNVSISNHTTVCLELAQKNSRTWDVNVSGSNFYLRDKSANKQRLGISSSSGAVYPPTSKAQSLGNGSYLWSEVFSSTGTINTSDEREKTAIVDPDDALMRAWGKVNFKVFQFKDAVEKKGADARLHIGVIAQQVIEAFASEGLDATRYGLLCYDKWEDEYEDVEVIDAPEIVADDGTVTPAVTHVEHRLVTPAGDRYGIRYEEALALEAAYQRWRMDKLEAALVGQGLAV